MYQNCMYCKSCAKMLFFMKLKKELYIKVLCTVKVMMRFYISEHLCYNLCTKLYLQVITFQRKKIMEQKSFPTRTWNLLLVARTLISICPRGRRSWEREWHSIQKRKLYRVFGCGTSGLGWLQPSFLERSQPIYCLVACLILGTESTHHMFGWRN